MINFDNYPMGVTSNTSNAPWNDPDDNEEIAVDVSVTQELIKNTKIYTTEYDSEVDCDEDGVSVIIDYDTINYEAEYNNQHYMPLELIAKYKELLQQVKDFKEGRIDVIEVKYIDHMIKECDGWEENDMYITQVK